MAIWH